MRLLRSVSLHLFALSLTIVVVLALTVLFVQEGARRQQRLTERTDELAHRVFLLHQAQRSLSALRLLQGNLGAALVAADAGWQARTKQALVEARAQFDLELDQLAPFAATASAQVRGRLDEVPHRLAAIIAAMRAGKHAEAEELTRGLHRLVQAMAATLEQAELREAEVFAALRAEDHAAIQQRLRWAWYSTIATVVLSLLLGLTVNRSLVRPLRRVVTAVRKVAAGDAHVTLPVQRADEFGDISEALQQFRDQAERLRTLAYRDPMTGLANRARLEDALHSGIVQCARNGTSLALLFLDLDNFKSVNESLGHSAGDRFLREAARRLQRLAPENALICRYSGDKFTVVLESVKRDGTQRARLRSVAEALLRGMAEPYPSNGDSLYMTVSIGIAVYPADGQSAEQVVSSADAAMYLAKRSGRNNVQFSSPDLTEDARRRLHLAGEIRRGLMAAEFEPYYQPIVNVRTGAVVGAEALLRWNHPQRGVVLPGEFIGAAEEAGLIGELGEHCLTRAYRQVAHWSREGREIPVAVNLSARQLQEDKVISLMQRLQAELPVAPQCLEFEITESAMMERPQHSQRVLQEIRRRGHRLGIDDFGTGHSALGYLQHFPIDRIKIDRSFVERVDSSRQSRAIISATLALADSLGLDVVAEGVESAGQLQQMKDLGCDLQQGYYFTAPLRAAEFEAWLASRIAARPE